MASKGARLTSDLNFVLSILTTNLVRLQDLQELFSLPKEGFDISLTQRQLNEEHDCHNTMDESLQKHVQFLERQGIAGVSHHSLLFSKTANLGIVPDEDVQRKKGNVIVRSSASTPSMAYGLNGVEYAFNPRDVKSSFSTVTSMVPRNEKKEREKEMEEKLKRLSHTLANEAVVSNLPDRGERIRSQIRDLKLKLSELRTSLVNGSNAKEAEIINLDDLADEMERVLSV
ncbi:hypothetical protein Taro_014537 [Colocasia esculenta]|uniref:Uncharacterized protein n=1 Tax=Colocasia esculenta TaxID=4460 RepID=A0A843UQE1_COLES|nr:hypothetical protein [Colocasia esculenta]